MALAHIDLVDRNVAAARFRIDTGTNRWYTIRIGREVSERAGYRLVDDIVAETPLRENPNGGGLLGTATEVSVRVPVERLDRGRGSAQLWSFRTRARLGPAFSEVVALSPALWSSEPDLALPESADMEPTVKTEPFLAPRAVPCRTHAEQMTAPALGDLLTEVMRIAGPIVAGLLGGTGGAGAGAAPASGPAGASADGAAPSAMLLGLLEALLRQLPGPAAAPVSTGQSLPAGEPSRFSDGHGRYARSFVFGVDDALLGAVIGQVVQVLPQLANAAGQQRLQLQADRNKLIGDIVGDVQRRMLLQQLLEAQRQAPAAQSPDLAQLAALLAQAGTPAPSATGATAPVTTGATAPVTTGQSLAADAAPLPSSRATVTFVTAPPLPYAGRDHVLLARGRALRLSVQLVVGAPVPSAPLARAIVRVVIKRADQSVVAEQVVKQRDLAAGATVPVTFTAADVAAAPAGEPVSLLAEIRWPTAAGRVAQASGGTEAVFVDGFFVKQRGGAAGPERELTDMDGHRAFWNKVWESPVLDAVTGGPRKLLWGLDATLKYCVLVCDEPSNGIMQTRLLAAAAAGDGIRAQIAGRMKGGIELSVGELNKLAGLWEGGAPLDDARLGALRSSAVRSAAGGEIVERLRLDGKAAQRGLVWAVPVLAPVSFTLGSVQSVDDAGQVTGIGEEQVRLPLPVAVRILGLTSSDAEGGDEAETGADADAYRFDGFAIRISDKIALTPKGSAPDG